MVGGRRERRSSRRSAKPVGAVVATLFGGAAILGYSAWVLPTAAQVYLRCNPPPTGTICAYHAFWGFSPTIFVIAALVGVACGGALLILGFFLWNRPRAALPIGLGVVAAAAVSVVAYGGAYAGLAMGVAGGVLAIRHRVGSSRSLTEWTPTGAAATESRDGSPPPVESGTAHPPPTIDPEAYAPLPPAPRRFPRPLPDAAPSGSPVRGSPDGRSPQLPQYTSISQALAAVRGEPAPRAVPVRTPSPSAPPPLPTPRSAEARTTVPLVPAASAPSETPGRVIAPPAAPPPGVTGAPPPLPAPPAATTPAAPPTERRQQTWKCTKCGLKNAPWSATCTRCRAPAPGA